MLLHSEVVSKPQIRSKGKAQAYRESAAYTGYVSIYRRPATQPLGLRWGFKTTSMQISEGYMPVSKIQSSPKNIRQATGRRQPTMNSALMQTG
jgi:hypothetical protein